MMDLGWENDDVDSAVWAHPELGQIDVGNLQAEHWHTLRESWRRKMYGALTGAKRHELRDEIIPVYSEVLVSSVRKKAQSLGTLGFILATGCIVSDYTRQLCKGGNSKFKVCGAQDHFFEERLQCAGLAIEADTNVLLRRFGWEASGQRLQMMAAAYH